MTEAIIGGSVDINNNELVELLKQHNIMIKHQNKILSNISDELKEIKYELNQIRGGL
jgi:hypothetical protein